VPSEVAQRAGIRPWEHIPFWCEPEEAGVMQADIGKAVAAGLCFRPLRQTVAETYAWLRESDHPRRRSTPRTRTGCDEWSGA
jgi:2'-hydroxyisoflavone reductase